MNISDYEYVESIKGTLRIRIIRTKGLSPSIRICSSNLLAIPKRTGRQFHILRRLFRESDVLPTDFRFCWRFDLTRCVVLKYGCFQLHGEGMTGQPVIARFQ